MPEIDASPLVLASTSVHRKALLGRLGLQFLSQSPGVGEDERANEPPRDRALRLAAAKAQAVAQLHPDSLVIGSDQVASLDDGGNPTLLHKPGNRARCIEQLSHMSGRSVDFHTAVALCAPGREPVTHLDHTRVRFRALTAEQISAYVDQEPAFDCAGGFKCEGLGVSLFAAVESVDPTALIGLPLIGLCSLLRDAGLSVPRPAHPSRASIPPAAAR